MLNSLFRKQCHINWPTKGRLFNLTNVLLPITLPVYYLPAPTARWGISFLYYIELSVQGAILYHQANIQPKVASVKPKPISSQLSYRLSTFLPATTAREASPLPIMLTVSPGNIALSTGQSPTLGCLCFN